MIYFLISNTFFIFYINLASSPPTTTPPPTTTEAPIDSEILNLRQNFFPIGPSSTTVPTHLSDKGTIF